MSISEQIKTLVNKFNNIDSKIEQLIQETQNQKKLLKEIDFIKYLGLSVSDMDLIEEYNDIGGISEEEIKTLMNLNDTLQKKLKWIDRVNEGIILENSHDWKVVNKNTIQYLLNSKKTKNERNNVIINCYVDTTKPSLTLEKLGIEKERGK